MQGELENVNRGTPDFPLTNYIQIKEKDYYSFSNLHWHRESEILYMKKGTVELSVGGDIFKMNQADIYFISPGELHLLSPITLPSAYNALVFSNSLITFPKGHFFEEEFTSPLEKGEIAFPRCIKPENEYYKEVSSLVKEICDNSGRSKFDTLLNLIKIFGIFKTNGLMEERKSKNPKSSEIKKCLDFMEEHYGEKITLSEIADIVHLTPNYLCFCFKTHTGSSPFTVLNNIRIRKAVAYLENTDEKILKISSLCGFESISFFIKKFKEIMGVSPSEYRKQRRSC